MRKHTKKTIITIHYNVVAQRRYYLLKKTHHAAEIETHLAQVIHLERKKNQVQRVRAQSNIGIDIDPYNSSKRFASNGHLTFLFMVLYSYATVNRIEQ